MYVRTELNVVNIYTDTYRTGSRSGLLRPDTVKVGQVPIIRGRGAKATFAITINSWVTFPISLTLPDIAYGSLFNRRTGLSDADYLPSMRPRSYELHIFGGKTKPECRLDSLSISSSTFRYVNILKSPSVVYSEDWIRISDVRANVDYNFHRKIIARKFSNRENLIISKCVSIVRKYWNIKLISYL